MLSIIPVVRCTPGPPITFRAVTMAVLRRSSIPNMRSSKSIVNRLWFANWVLQRMTTRPPGSAQRKRLFRIILGLHRWCTLILKIACHGGLMGRCRIGRSHDDVSPVTRVSSSAPPPRPPSRHSLLETPPNIIPLCLPRHLATHHTAYIDVISAPRSHPRDHIRQSANLA